MKLLIVTQTVDENDQLLGFFISWIKLLAYKFEQVTILCLNKGSYSLPANVKVVSLGKSEGASKSKQLFTFYRLIVSLRNDYGAVLVHMNPIWVVLGGPVWRLMGKKICFWYTHKSVTSKLRMAEKFADVIFTASRESFRLPSKKIIVTGHGIDTELFKPNYELRITNYELKILSVGRIAPVKNYETLVEAAKILKDGGVDFSVTVIGEAPLKEDKNYELRITNKIKELGLEKYFNFAGKVINKDLPEYYRSHDIFVHLSKTGSLDKTLLEAMACGMKVLSSNDSSKAFLPDELIFNENNPEELAAKISTLAEAKPDGKLREYVVQNHNLDNLINKISSIIVQLTY